MAHHAVPPSPHPFSADRASSRQRDSGVSAEKRFVFARHRCADTGSIYIVKRISDQRMTRQGDPPVTAAVAVPETEEKVGASLLETCADDLQGSTITGAARSSYP